MKPRETPADIRRERGLLLDDVAAKTRWPKSNASAFESGRLGASDEKIRLWADAVGVPYRRAYRAIWGAVARHCRRCYREALDRLDDRPRRLGA